jgi:RNA polymerase sigma-70 factor (ECF subfamily)
MDARRKPAAGVLPVARESLSPAPPSAEQIYYDYAPRVYRVARRMVRSHNDAEDVTQDVLLQVVRNLPSFRGESALPTWLHRVTVNAALAHRRRRSALAGGRACDPLAAVLERSHGEAPGRRWLLGPEAQMLDQEDRAVIERAVARLPEAYRRVFCLADVEGLPNQEVADALGLSLAAVKSRLHRARRLLRAAIAPHFTAYFS